MAIKINGVTVVDDSRVGDLVRLNVSSTAADAVAIAGGMDVTKDLQIGGNLSVTGTITGSITGTAPNWSTARTVTFAGGDVTGAFTIDGSADVPNIALTIEPNSIALGTDTTGNYVATVSDGIPGVQTGTSGLTIVAAAGEGTAATISHADTSTVANLSSDSSGSTFIQDISFTFDDFGHVTAASVATATALTSQSTDFGNFAIATDSGYTWGVLNTNTTQSADTVSDTLTVVNGAGIDLYASTVAGTDAIKIEHADTSTLTGAQGTAGIASFTIDGLGHITAVTTATYLTAEVDTLQAVTTRGNTTDTAVLITNITESTSVDTGALQVDGGVGINKNLYVGGDLDVTGTLTLNSTGAVKMPVGTTLQQPTGIMGQLRFNSETGSFEGFNGVVWGAIGGGDPYPLTFSMLGL
jgi:hypothetical protein